MTTAAGANTVSNKNIELMWGNEEAEDGKMCVKW